MRLNPLARTGLIIVVVAVVGLLIFRALTNGSGNRTASAPNGATGPEGTGEPGTEGTPAPSRDVVYRAAHDIPPGTLLTPAMFTEQDAPDEGGTGSYVTNLRGDAVGYITRVRIPSGGTLRREDLLGHVTTVGLAGMVQPGLRAMVVPITGKSGYGILHDLVKVGDFVDIIASVDRQQSRSIVQNVRVLAVDVFAAEYPNEKSIAQRGSFRADRNADAAPPAPPAGAPGPTPTPEGTPPPRPEPALTLEVTPAMATAIALAMATASPLDFLIHPKKAPGSPPDVPIPADTTRPQLASYADRMTRPRPAAPARAASTTVRTVSSEPGGPRRRRGGNGDLPSPPIFELGGPMGPAIPLPAPTPVPPPETYSIPIIADGRPARMDVVRKPADMK